MAALTKLPAGASLTVSPALVHPSAGAILLRNTSGHPVRWSTASGASWLEVSPPSGTLAPGAVTELDTRILPAAPEGDVRVPVTITGDDGSAAAALVVSTVEHPPTLAATITGCVVKATADDETDVALVLLHWRGAGSDDEHSRTMVGPTSNPAVSATIPRDDAPVTWWVTAVDGRGNRAATAELRLVPGSC